MVPSRSVSRSRLLSSAVAVMAGFFLSGCAVYAEPGYYRPAPAYYYGGHGYYGGYHHHGGRW